MVDHVALACVLGQGLRLQGHHWNPMSVIHCVAPVTDCWHDFVLLTMSGCMWLGGGHRDSKQTETIKADPSILSSHPL